MLYPWHLPTAVNVYRNVTGPDGKKIITADPAIAPLIANCSNGSKEQCRQICARFACVRHWGAGSRQSRSR
jgi:hypothetical protein